MAQPERDDAETQGPGDGVTDEIGRLLSLVRRLEHENAILRRELANARPVAA
jgi:hypothetical protein